MFYRTLLISILFFNLLISQSFFNSSFGNETGFQSAKSYAIGQTHFMNSNTSVLALRNPAKLGFLEQGIRGDFNLSGFMYTERRSIDLQDYFGDFLTEGDYALNNNFYNYEQFGVLGNFKIFSMNFGFAVSNGPWSSMNYRYEEEVRGSASYDDGIIGIRDPIVGYHILEHKGKINLTSVALGLGINESISFGLGINMLHDGKHKYNMRVVQIGESSENLAPITNESGSSDFSGDVFPSISGIFKKSSFELAFGYEHSAEIKGDNNVLYSNTSGLPIYISPGTLSDEVFTSIDPGDASAIYEVEDNFELRYSAGFSIQKPKKIKIGLNHKEGSKSNSRLFSFEVIKNQFNNSIFYQDFHNINLGIEYTKYNRVLRIGLAYKEPSVQVLSPVTTFCFGTSREFNNLVFDLGASYSYQQYKYHDLFPVRGDIRPDFDTVHESNWSLISTISYTF